MLWLIDWESKCVERFHNENVEKKCYPDQKLLELIGISPEDYNKERKYQDRLKKECYLNP